MQKHLRAPSPHRVLLAVEQPEGRVVSDGFVVGVGDRLDLKVGEERLDVV